MILNKTVKIKINSRNFSFYKEKIIDIKNNKEYEINIDDILPTSHTKIIVKCDVCNSESNKPYRDYMKSKNKYDFYCCSPKCALIKNKKTNLSNFGCENPFSNQKIKDKIKNNILDKYQVEYPSQSPIVRGKIERKCLDNYGVKNVLLSYKIQNKIKETNLAKYGACNILSSKYMENWKIKNGKKIPDDLKSNYKKYQEKVRYLTNLNKEKLFKNWNGLDYYDNESIKDNLNLKFYNKNYPTIDHKMSVYFGFVSNISPEEIADINNLCITKRKINAKKGTKIEDVFIKTFKIQ